MKNKSLYCFFILLSVIIHFNSCTREFIEPDLSNKQITNLSPADGMISVSATQTFTWDSLPGTRYYNLQITSPSFTSNQQIIIDTLLVRPRFVYVFTPGKTYQWRLRAQNSFSKTQYVTNTLRIDSTSDLSTQSVYLLFPSINYYYSSSSQNTFRWAPLYNAQNYHFQIFNQSGSLMLADTSISGTSFTARLPEGSFTIQVRAQNVTSSSPYTARTFIIDTIPPAPSSPQSPLSGANITGNDTLRWILASDRSADSLFIALDSTFIQTHTVNYRTTNTMYVFSSGVSGKTYFW
jgi:hypothetical protein